MRWFQPISVLVMCGAHCRLQAAEVPSRANLSPQQTLRVDLLEQPKQLDPQFRQTVYEAWVLEDLFEPLISTDVHGNPCPGAATSWESNHNKTVWTFYLRPEACWSNGESVKAEHFVYACRRLVRSKSPLGQAAAADWKWKNALRIREGKCPVETLGVVAVDDYTLRFHLAGPVLHFPVLCGREVMPLYPRQQVAQTTRFCQPSNQNSVVTNGAFCNLQYHPNVRFEVSRNPYYWDNDKTVIEAVHYFFSKETPARYSQFEKYQTDLSYVHYEPEEKQDFYERFASKILEVQGLAARSIHVNTRSKDLCTSQLRLALSMVIDRKALLAYIDEPQALPAYTLLHPRSLDSTLPQPYWVKLAYLERCREARELTRWLNPGYELTLLCKQAAGLPTYLQAVWKKELGITLKLKEVDLVEKLELRTCGQYDLSLHSCVLPNLVWDAAFEAFESNSSKNYMGYRSANFSALFRQVTDPQLPQETREGYVKQLNLLLAKEVPEIPLYFAPIRFLVQPYVGGLCKDNLLCRFKAKDLYILKNDIADLSFDVEAAGPKESKPAA